MSDFKILIVEDEPLYAANLEMLVEELGYTCTGVADNAEAALQKIGQQAPDLILMDINIVGQTDGIALAEQINRQQPVPVIFITSLQDDTTFNRAKAIRPYAFVSKPFSEADLQRTIELAVSRLSDTESEDENNTWSQDILFKNCFFIKVRQQLVKVPFEEILFLEVDKHYCTIVTADKKFIVRMSLKELLGKLPADLFLQTHRRYIVNASKIESFDLADSVVQVAGHSIALSRGYKTQVLEQLSYLL